MGKDIREIPTFAATKVKRQRDSRAQTKDQGLQNGITGFESQL